MTKTLFDSKAAIVAEDIKRRIIDGEFSHLKKLPSTVQLSASYSVSKETINTAMSQLVRKGIIMRKRGFGSVVSQIPQRKQTKPHLGIYLPMLENENSSLTQADSPVWYSVFYGALQACAKRGYTLIPIPNIGKSWDEIVADHELGGVVLPGGREAVMESFFISGMHKKIKYCMINRATNFDAVNFVEEFSIEEIERIVNGLADKGHKEIVAVGSDENRMLYQHFFDGYRSAMTQKGLYTPSNVKRINDNTPEEYDILVNELMSHINPPSVILAFHYKYAEGIMAAFERREIKCPDDISVVMINFERNSYKARPITGFISPNKQEFGATAANCLMDIIENKVAEPVHINLKLSFCDGETFEKYKK